MAEAIAAFGLASNILQFIGFSGKLAERFYAFYKSSRNHEILVPDVKILAQDLERILKELKESEVGQVNRQGHFQSLARECSVIAIEMLDMFHSLNQANEGTIPAIKAAFKSIWKEGDIDNLLNRLSQFRDQLVLNLLLESRVQIRKSGAQQAELLQRMEEKIDRIGDLSVEHTSTLGSRLVDAVVSKLEITERLNEKKILEGMLKGRLVSSRASDIDETIPEISQSRKTQFTNQILSQLYFPGQDDRRDGILPAHAETFKWIFDDKNGENTKWAKISDWLSSDDQLYWVTGKAGSGKSTLMKYICECYDGTVGSRSQEPPRYTRYLQSWAPAPLKLLTATYYLWNSGTESQRSQYGLLRSLLYQILSQAPELIPLAISGRWEVMCLFGDYQGWIWSTQGLVEMLNSTIARMKEDMRLCLFVDGLDEFDGEPSVLISLFRGLLKSPKVKLCVSSRPWDVFESAFDRNPSLRMELLTHDDIKSYVSARFTLNVDFVRLQKREPQYAGQLIKNIIEKASGVFLWVRLVVTSLLAGFGNADRLSDLQRRLDLLPPELEKLYDKMLDSLDPFYLEHAAQLFLLTENTTKLNTVLLSFVDDETVASALNRRVEPLKEDEVLERQENMRRRINSRTKGLLEVLRPLRRTNHDHETIEGHSLTRIQYLHRTVYDHIKSDAVQARLMAILKTPFDANMQYCVGLLAYLKTLTPTPKLFARDSEFWYLITSFMQAVSKVKEENRQQTFDLIDALDGTASNFAKAVCHRASGDDTFFRTWHDKLMSAGLWLVMHPCVEPSRGMTYPVSSGGLKSYHFHGFAIASGLLDYVEARVKGACLVPLHRDASRIDYRHSGFTQMYSLLNDAISGSMEWRNKYDLSIPNPDMVACLIRKGARVDLRFGDEAAKLDPAMVLAAVCTQSLSEESRASLSQIVELLIAHYDAIWPKKVLPLSENFYRHILVYTNRFEHPSMQIDVQKQIRSYSHQSHIRFWRPDEATAISNSRLKLLETISRHLKW